MTRGENRHKATRRRTHAAGSHRNYLGQRTLGPVDEYDDELDCTWCAGTGESECLDPIGCTLPHAWNEPCECGACGGTGLRSKQTVF